MKAQTQKAVMARLPSLCEEQASYLVWLGHHQGGGYRTRLISVELSRFAADYKNNHSQLLSIQGSVPCGDDTG